MQQEQEIKQAIAEIVIKYDISPHLVVLYLDQIMQDYIDLIRLQETERKP